jgi:6-pyruvoyltetrahydropterin/6-carboxytetrahydropterin synthase
LPSKKYTLAVMGHFSAAHFLEGYKGACEDLHGHNWKVELRVSTARLDRIGLGGRTS